MSIVAFLGILAAALILAIVFLALIARINDGDDAETPPPPTEPEPLGDQVDVRAILRRYE